VERNKERKLDFLRKKGERKAPFNGGKGEGWCSGQARVTTRIIAMGTEFSPQPGGGKAVPTEVPTPSLGPCPRKETLKKGSGAEGLRRKDFPRRKE